MATIVQMHQYLSGVDNKVQGMVSSVDHHLMFV